MEYIIVRLVELDRMIHEAEDAATTPTAERLGVSLEELRSRPERLRRLRAVYQRQLEGFDAPAPLAGENKKQGGGILSPGEKFSWYHVGVILYHIWNFEIVTISNHPITVGKIILGLIVLAAGLMFARRAARFVFAKTLSHLHVEKGAAAAIERIFHYLITLIVVLFSLQVVNIPLTIFAFFGGAVAIAFGFGAQNILSNFISGLILFLERPIKIGDLVDVEGQLGRVEEIGARCTRIRLFTGIHLLVPNSDFLEKEVVNWTLSDEQVRMMVAVGVAYGSPTREVQRLIYKAVDEHPLVLKEPKPKVLFMNFGDNALEFEVHFWLAINSIEDSRQVRSEIRFRIDDLFREAGITIAFPQRDLHLDTLKPLDIRLVSDKKP
jgi:small-conductance mechanosensitive channel